MHGAVRSDAESREAGVEDGPVKQLLVLCEREIEDGSARAASAPRPQQGASADCAACLFAGLVAEDN
eukprot:9463594-Pyramimonas_sp.AAC.1